MLEAAAPDSALAKHRLGRMNTATTPTNFDRTNVSDKDMVKNLFASSRVNTEVKNLPLPEVNFLPDCCQAVYASKLMVDEAAAVDLCCETATSSSKWKTARQFRITGSRCYGIYTYGSRINTDWSGKSRKYFWPTNVCTKAMRHGLEHEAKAREVDSSLLECTVKELGLIVSPLQPWLAYSPDGVVVDGHNTPIKLLEIKCPLHGENVSAPDLIDSLPYITFVNNDVSKGITLKKKHMYYGQVQLGMAMINVKSCDFVLFSSFDKSIQVIKIDYDEQFVAKLLSKLQRNFFLNMIHEICKSNVEI